MASEGLTIGGKYNLLECIGRGTFGEVFYGMLLVIVSR